MHSQIHVHILYGHSGIRLGMEGVLSESASTCANEVSTSIQQQSLPSSPPLLCESLFPILSIRYFQQVSLEAGPEVVTSSLHFSEAA